MIAINKNHLIMCICLMSAATLCLGHVFTNNLIILLAMALFIISIIWTSLEGKVAYILCFFLPWATLVKFAPGETSIYTIGLIGSCILTFIRHRIPTKRYIFPAAALIGLMLFVKLFFGFGIDRSFILFCILLLLFPAMGLDLRNSYAFDHLTSFFSVGIISAALSAYFLVQYPAIARFIDVYSFREVVRYSGYYGDANFYSAHISAALAGVLLVLLKSRNKIRIYIVLAITLLYCGLLSASKSFVITICCSFFLWILQILYLRGNLFEKIGIFIVLIAVVAGIMASGIFSDLFYVIAIRFNQVSNLSDLTTKRSDIWMNYLEYFKQHPMTLLMGKGFTNVLVGGRASHNTPIQIVYQFGVLGAACFAFWLRYTLRLALGNIKLESKYYLLFSVLLSGVLIPWMGLDLLFFDEFFLMLFYLCAGVYWLQENI